MFYGRICKLGYVVSQQTCELLRPQVGANIRIVKYKICQISLASFARACPKIHSLYTNNKEYVRAYITTERFVD